MEGMTTEERFTRIENILVSLTDGQVRQEIAIEKQNAGIRDLIVVSRTAVESQQRAGEQIRQLSDQVLQVSDQVGELTSEVRDLTSKVNQLTENIDKLIQGRGPNGR
jgi:phage shock protein A